MNIVERVKNISFGIVLLALVIMLFLLFGDVEYYGLLSVYIFLFLWSLDKIYLWYFNFDFGITNQLRIKKDAPKVIRLLGLILVLFVLYIALIGLLQQTAT